MQNNKTLSDGKDTQTGSAAQNGGSTAQYGAADQYGTQEERRKYLIGYLLHERRKRAEIPEDEDGQKRLLRALFNVREPAAASEEFLAVQDAYLQEESRLRGITDLDELTPVHPDIYLWRGDITTLRCDGIVNAANPEMLGCFVPGHHCIDNAIHTFAGIQLRLECDKIMKKQGCEEQTGDAKITRGYNLPCKYVLHTVGPVVYGELMPRQERQLASCYRSCLALADKRRLKSLAFCCISTGEYGFPGERGAEIAVRTVLDYKRETASKIKVIFNVFKERDLNFYRRLLGGEA